MRIATDQVPYKQKSTCKTSALVRKTGHISLAGVANAHPHLAVSCVKSIVFKPPHTTRSSPVHTKKHL